MTVPANLITRNANRFAVAKLTRGPEFIPVAKRLVAQKARYQSVEKRTGVPWYVIAVIHQRESSQDFARSLAQGDPWDRVSVRIPKGRGPFKSWEDAAYDALVNCPPYAARWKDWSVGGTLALLESYNGLGYYHGPVTKENGVVVKRYPSQPSPYIWSGTDQYRIGKYVRDGVFDPAVVDKQLGCAGLILAMKEIDASIDFGGKPNVGPAVAKGAGTVIIAGTAAGAAKQKGLSDAATFGIFVGIVLAVAVIVAAVKVYRKKG